MHLGVIAVNPILFLIEVTQLQQVCFYLAEEKSKMRNRGKRGGRRVGCIVCGRLTVLVTGVYCGV